MRLGSPSNNLLNLEIPRFFLTFFFLSSEGKSYLQPDQGFTGCLQLKIRTVEEIDLESVQLETGGRAINAFGSPDRRLRDSKVCAVAAWLPVDIPRACTTWRRDAGRFWQRPGGFGSGSRHGGLVGSGFAGLGRFRGPGFVPQRGFFPHHGLMTAQSRIRQTGTVSPQMARIAN
jgi:hypothetical protein